MDKTVLIYLIFALAVGASLFIDLGVFSKRNATVSFRSALTQTFFWVFIALCFMGFLWYEEGRQVAIEYVSAYLMEWSLSIDNIFVFIVIFSAFKVKEEHQGRVLLVGILMAIVLRLLFITIGVALVNNFHWILYVFGVFLIYTAYKMFTATDDEEFRPMESKFYRLLNTYLPLTTSDGGGRYIIRENGKPMYTSLFVVVALLGAVDFLFALDSLPAVIGISRDRMVVYSSNVFAVLGLRSLFFLLKTAISKFDYLQQGISFVLFFIGVKMLLEHWLDARIEKHTQVYFSLLFIICCLSLSIVYSILHKKRGTPSDSNTK